MKTVVHTLSISFAKTRCAGAPRLCVSILGVLVLVPVVVFAEAPLAVPVDGDPFHGKLTSIDAHWKLGFLAGGGAPGAPPRSGGPGSRSLAADDLVAWGHPAELRKGPIVVLADGGRLAAAVTGADKTRLSVISPRFGPLSLPLDLLAGIVFRAPARPQDLDAMLDRIAGDKGRADRLLLDNGDEVAGLIESLSGDSVAIKGDLGRVEVPMRRVVAVVFNPALRRPPAARAGAAWIGLADGTRLLAAAAELRGDALELTTVAGEKWKAKAEDVVFLMPQSGRAVFLSDIRPDEYRFLPYLEMKWPYRTDRNVTGGQLRVRRPALREGPRRPQRRPAELQARSTLGPLSKRDRHR